jgi:alkylation response protein AidB-like acyl-CoA dehydrogenase
VLASLKCPPSDDVVPSLLDVVRRFCSAEVNSARIDREACIPRGVLRGLADLGLFGLTLPTSYGGAGLGLHEACRVIAELARFDRSVATTVGVHLGLGTRALIAFGSKSLQERFLPALASGAKIAAFSTTEPGSGSDLSNLATRGVMSGGELVINGEKIYVTNGGFADVFTLTVSTPGVGGAERGQSLVILDRATKGFTVGPEESKLGLKGSSTTSLALEDVRVPAMAVVGEAGRGADELHHVLSWGRTLMGAGCCGTAQVAVERMREHTASRRQFGKPLDSLEVVQEQLATASARLFAMQALVERVSSVEADFASLGVRSLAAKVFCSEGAGEIVDVCVQLHGGAGFIEGTGVPLLARDARITRIFEGANDVLLTQMGAQELVAAPRRSPLASAAGATSLAAVARGADQLADDVAAVRTATQEKYRVGALRQKRLLHRLGRALCWRDAADAAVLEACSTTNPHYAALATLFVEQARHEAARSLTAPVGLDVITPALRATPGSLS